MSRRLVVLIAVLAGVLTLVTPAAVATADPASLVAGDTLEAGDVVPAPGGQRHLVVQDDGNVVLYGVGTDQVFFTTGTEGHPGATLTLQRDGNLVVYGADGLALWSNQVFVGAAAQVAVNDDGTVCESVGGGTPVWCGGQPPRDVSRPSILGRGGSLASGGGIGSPTGRFVLGVGADAIVLHEYEAGPGMLSSLEVWQPVGAQIGNAWVLAMQTDGNLVAYANGRAVWSTGTVGSGADRLAVQDDGNLVVYAGSRAVWASGTTPRQLAVGQTLTPGTRWAEIPIADESIAGGTLVMQTDGNLVTYDRSGNPRWFTGTAGHPGARATLQLDGNFVVSDAAGRPLWATGTAGCGRHLVFTLSLVVFGGRAVTVGASPYYGVVWSGDGTRRSC